MRLYSYILIVYVCLTMFGCSKEKTEPKIAFAPLVKVETVKRSNIPLSNQYVGQTEGSKSVELKAQVSGILKSKDYNESEYVQAGQVLFNIDPASYIASLEAAKGGLAQTKANALNNKLNLMRVKSLYEKNAVSRMELDNAQAAYDASVAEEFSARAKVNEAEIMLGYTKVVSPVSGFASKANVSVGNLITKDSSFLTEINQVDPIFVNFAIPYPEFQRARVLTSEGRMFNDNVSASIKYANGIKYPILGTIVFVNKQVNPSTNTITARASFPNKDLQIMPGQFVDVQVNGSILKDAMLIPQRAIIQINNATLVVVVDKDDVAHYRPVVLSDNFGETFLVDSGLEAGERIVVEGNNKARPNAKVRIDNGGK